MYLPIPALSPASLACLHGCRVQKAVIRCRICEAAQRSAGSLFLETPLQSSAIILRRWRGRESEFNENLIREIEEHEAKPCSHCCYFRPLQQPRSGRRVVLFLTLEAIVGCVLSGTFKVLFSVWNNACVYGWCCFVSAKDCRTKLICLKSFLLSLPISLFQQTWHRRDSTDVSSVKKQPYFYLLNSPRLFMGELCRSPACGSN